MARADLVQQGEGGLEEAVEAQLGFCLASVAEALVVLWWVLVACLQAASQQVNLGMKGLLWGANPTAAVLSARLRARQANPLIA